MSEAFGRQILRAVGDCGEGEVTDFEEAALAMLTWALARMKDEAQREMTLLALESGMVREAVADYPAAARGYPSTPNGHAR